MVPKPGLYWRGLLKSLMDGAIPFFFSEDPSHVLCLCLLLFVGASPDLPRPLTW